MATTNPTVDLAALGDAAGELMHDMLGLISLVEGRTALVLGEMRTGRTAVEEAEAALQECRDLKLMVSEVAAAFGGVPVNARFRPLELARSEIDRAVRISAPAEVSLHSWISVDTEVAGPTSFFRRALSNLLRNALRHAESRVDVSLLPRDQVGRQGVMVVVENDGQPIPAEIRARLFQVGSHGGHGGTGLGLASAAWVVDRLGGTISNHAPQALSGARFEVWLPTVRLRADAPPSTARPGALSGRHLVVIDDDISIQRVFTRLFERAGARVTTPAVPEAWAAALAGADPDAVLLDLNLGGRDGVDLWREIAEHRPLLARRVIFVSGVSVGDRAEQATLTTRRPVLSKALDFDQLMRAIEVEILLSH
jgi:CheY-like chemotaxis protein